MKKYIVLTVSLLIAVTVQAQSLVGDSSQIATDSIKGRMLRTSSTRGYSESNKFMPTIVPSSPQAQLFEKYITTPVVPYTGVAEVSIPLFNLELDGLTIPLTLSYHGGGIKHTEFTGEVGAGWVLNVGGYRVNRSIFGKCDFHATEFNEEERIKYMINQPPSTSPLRQRNYRPFIIDSYLYAISRYSWGIPTCDVPFIRALSIQEKITTDGEYDQFNYQTPSSSGAFLLTNRESKYPTVEKVEPNLDRFNYIRLDSISITDGNGYDFIFGGKKKFKNGKVEELTEKAQLGPTYGSGNTWVPTSWLLSSIVSPHGRKANISYTKYTDVRDLSHTQTLSITEPIYYRGTLDDELQDHYPSMQNNYAENKNSTVYNNLHFYKFHEELLYIDKIQTDNVTIEIVRNNSNSAFPERFINKIIVKDALNGNVIKEISFSYKNMASASIGTDRIKYTLDILESVTIHGQNQNKEQKYILDYYGGEKSFDKVASDQWGYIKGYHGDHYFFHNDFKKDIFMMSKGMGATLQPRYEKLGDMLRQNNLFTDRGYTYNSSVSNYSLKQITYPTGGYRRFNYEPHQVDKGYGGGQRIKNIENYTNTNSLASKIDYKYGKDENGKGEETIELKPEHFKSFEIVFASHPTEHSRIVDPDLLIYAIATRTYSNKTQGDITPSLYSVYYPEVHVKEYDTVGAKYNGKTVYRYLTDTDYYQIGRLRGAKPLDPRYEDFKKITNNDRTSDPDPEYVSRYKLGLNPVLYEQVSLNSKNDTIAKEYFKYKLYQGKEFNGYKVYKTLQSNNGRYLQEQLNSSSVGGAVLLHDYIGSIFASGPYGISLNHRKLEAKTSVSYADGIPTTVKEEYSYDDKNRLNYSMQNTSVGKNITKTYTYPPVGTGLNIKNMEATVITTETNNAGSLSKVRTDYSQNAILPNKILTSSSKISGETLEVEFNKYDTKGNILQYTGKDNIPVTYLWSYNSQYPIAEIRNATYTQVEKAVSEVFGLTVEALSKLSNLYKANEGKLQKLRSNVNLSFAQVSTYTYKPLVGMLSATAPNGITTYYEYDAFGRLKRTYYKEGTLERNIESNEYNYRNK